MNLASQSGETGCSQLLFANFNQDNTSLAVGTKSGYKFFSLSSVDKLEQIYECTDTEDVCIVERLFSSSLVAIVSLKAPRKLKVCHFKKGTEICNYSYSNTILAVKLNRQVGTHLSVCVCCVTEICNYSYSNTILAVKLNRQVGTHLSVCVCCATEICNYSYSNTILAVKLNRQADSMSGRVSVRPQHQRHEGPTHHQRDSTQPLRAVRSVHQ
ncbi:WD repeat domain phosphoinositide-interacting protein 2 isoform X3 [Salmo salar]|uniref:WD repeat domain phosphoinositide-interacting protein 2 isoform X3 n=1 Tax=Salmo salar TaxID=8030 RepID=A0ABM3E9C4_SALSA|nr:WD repeat domain phosphoinositide-interacting protein 2 isoform X3 [Salmo salar]